MEDDCVGAILVVLQGSHELQKPATDGTQAQKNMPAHCIGDISSSRSLLSSDRESKPIDDNT